VRVRALHECPPKLTPPASCGAPISDDKTVAKMGHPVFDGPRLLMECGEFVASLFAEVAVVFVDPVLAGWGEDVEVDAV
jgi:hypothetical protein